MQLKSLFSITLTAVVSVSVWAVPNRVVDRIAEVLKAGDRMISINEVTLAIQVADADTFVACQNEYKISRVIGQCDPSKSRGWRSSHNCGNNSGKFYYCWRDGAGECYNLRNIGEQFEGGECFL